MHRPPLWSSAPAMSFPKAAFRRVHSHRAVHALNPKLPLLFHAPSISIFPGVMGVTAGGVPSGIASFVPPPPEEK